MDIVICIQPQQPYHFHYRKHIQNTCQHTLCHYVRHFDHSVQLYYNATLPQTLAKTAYKQEAKHITAVPAHFDSIKINNCIEMNHSLLDLFAPNDQYNMLLKFGCCVAEHTAAGIP